MIAQEQVQKYGGKAAILMYVQRKLPSLPIPPFVVLEHGQSVDAVLGDFNAMRKPVIVRSSSPHEYGDFEGIFDTVRDVDDRTSLEGAVSQVRASATSERAIEYARQNGFAIDERMNVIVQEQSPSNETCAMLRHPNNPLLLLINAFRGRGEFTQSYRSILFNEYTKSHSDNRVVNPFDERMLDQKTALDLSKQYSSLESLTEIAPGYSLLVEFGLDPFALYQVRPFKEIKTTDFDLPSRYKEDSRRIWSDFVFGITPPDGLVLPVFRSFGETEATKVIGNRQMGLLKTLQFNEVDTLLESELRQAFDAKYGFGIDVSHADLMQQWNLQGNDMMDGQAYCFMTSSANRDHYDVDLSVPNMKALILSRSENLLVHGLVRLFKKADVALAHPTLWVSDFFGQTTSIDDKVRIISNGREAVAIRE